MSAVGPKPGILMAPLTKLNEDAERARQMLATSKELWNDPVRCGEAIKLRADGQALFDQTIDQALRAAGPLKDRPSSEQRSAAGFAAELARESAVRRMEELGEYLQVASVFDEAPDPKIVQAPGTALNVASNANNRARFGDDGQPLYAPVEHMTAIQITLQRVTMARQFGDLAIDVSPKEGKVAAPVLDDLAQAREAVKLVRAQRADRAALAGAPPEMVQLITQRTTNIDDAATAVTVQSTSMVGVLALGMVTALATPEQIAAMPVDAGMRTALAGIADRVRRSVGASDAASFKGQVGADWTSFVWQFVSRQLGQLDQTDPVAQQASQAVVNDVAMGIEFVTGQKPVAAQTVEASATPETPAPAATPSAPTKSRRQARRNAQPPASSADNKRRDENRGA